jgi:hypothetical protein
MFQIHKSQYVDTFGCTPCFCFDHSSICYPADGFNAVNITSEFFEEWVSPSYGSIKTRKVPFFIFQLGGSELRPEDVQWAQVCNLNKKKFYCCFYIKLDKAAAVSQLDLVLPIFSQGNPLPDTEEQHYRFRIVCFPLKI